MSVAVPTQLSGRLDVDVVVAAADADDDSQSFELLQVLPGQGDGMVHHGPHCLIQHLQAHSEQRQPQNSVHTNPASS